MNLFAIAGIIAIGISLGLTGSGGSILTLPFLGYLVGLPPNEAVGVIWCGPDFRRHHRLVRHGYAVSKSTVVSMIIPLPLAHLPPPAWAAPAVQAA